MKVVDTQTFDYSTDYFLKMASGWNRISFPIIEPFVRKGLALFCPETILDVGCGNGIYGHVLREKGAKLFGIDMAQESVVLCMVAGYDHVNLMPAERIAHGDKKFDMVFSSEVIEHVKPYDKMLSEINRVLKPGGGLVLTTTCYSTSYTNLFFTEKAVLKN